MKRRVTGILVAVILSCLSLPAQEQAWEQHTDAGKNFMAGKQYAEAEASFRESLKDAQNLKLGEKDVRYSGSLLMIVDLLVMVRAQLRRTS